MKCPKCTDDIGDYVHAGELTGKAERLKTAEAAKTAAEARVTELEGKLKAAGKGADRITELEAQLTSLQAAQAQWDTERAVMGAGITDPEGVSIAAMLYGRLEEGARPKGGIAEWLTGDAVPKAVRAYLPQAQVAAEATGATQGATGGQRQSTEQHTRTFTQAPASYTNAQIAGLNADEYHDQREQVWRSMGVAPPKRPAWLPSRD